MGLLLQGRDDAVTSAMGLLIPPWQQPSAPAGIVPGQGSDLRDVLSGWACAKNVPKRHRQTPPGAPVLLKQMSLDEVLFDTTDIRDVFEIR
jgi:hypothetical protein